MARRHKKGLGNSRNRRRESRRQEEMRTRRGSEVRGGLTQQLAIGSISPYPVNDWETEFALGEIFCESFVIGVLRVSFHILSSNGTIKSVVKRRVGTVILANVKQQIRQISESERTGVKVITWKRGLTSVDCRFI